MHKAQRALLNDSTCTHTISHHLNDEEAYSTLKLREIKFLPMPNISRHLISVLVALGSIETIQIHSSVKRLQVFLVVGFSVEFEDFHVQLLNVLNYHLQGDILVDPKQLFVFLSELEHHLLLHLLEVVKSDLVLIQRRQSIPSQVALPTSLDFVKILRANDLPVLVEGAASLLTEVVQVLVHQFEGACGALSSHV